MALYDPPLGPLVLLFQLFSSRMLSAALASPAGYFSLCLGCLGHSVCPPSTTSLRSSLLWGLQSYKKLEARKCVLVLFPLPSSWQIALFLSTPALPAASLSSCLARAPVNWVQGSTGGEGCPPREMLHCPHPGPGHGKQTPGQSPWATQILLPFNLTFHCALK